MLLSIILVGGLGLSSFGVEFINCTVTELGIPTLDLFPINSRYANARSVWGITEFEGRIYIGCGNFNTNAGTGVGGSLPVYSYDLATQSWRVEYNANTEQIARFYKKWDNLYVPATDHTTGSYGVYYYKEDGTWGAKSTGLRAEHIFDMHFMADGKTVFAGVDPYTSAQPYVARSTDGGVKWTRVYFTRNGVAVKGTSGVFYRTYNIFEYRGEVYATLWASSDTLSANMGLYKYNGATDTMEYYAPTHENLIKNNMTVGSDFTFNGKFVNVYNGFYVYSDDLKSCEERTAPSFLGTPVCAKVIGDAVYMVSYSPKTSHVESYIYKSTDLTTFTMVGAVKLPDSYILSFDYHEGTFYMGTSWSETQSQTNGTVFSVKLNRQGCTHKNLITEIVPDTCFEDGLQTDSCPDCGYVNKTVLHCDGHDYPEEWTICLSPSCTEEGIEGRSCNDCGENENRTVSPLGHEFSPEYTTDVYLTCTQNGRQSRHCVRCPEITDVITTPAPGHVYADYICTACGEGEPFRPGDCNGDTEVNVIDMTLAARYIAQQGSEGAFDLTACDMTATDFNLDGVIDQLDLNLLAEHILAEN